MKALTSRRFARQGLLTPAGARVLRARSVILQPGQAMAWHTTGAREELLLAIAGVVQLEAGGVGGADRGRHRIRLAAGRCCFLPSQTRHRLVNRSRQRAHYLYITAPRRLG